MMPRLTAFARLRRIVPALLVCLLLLTTVAVAPLQAQTLPGLPSTGSGSADAAASDGQAEVDALIKLLEDPEGREKLIERLKAAETPATPAEGEELAAELVMPFL
ncbi:MAG TPA: hypothetical protein DCK97_24410, partial [Tistrella mobilis]|nr:hypothetical protein [Tistrella mobilis]